ncbi:MAG TPA: class I SAM-dependent methyltransferase [Acidimicrobiia bacterium]|nr:class I SAM-dependent methyltransferase [Acidimicrobiia bacterium]
MLATDIEPRLQPLRDLGNVDVARHDVAADPLPEAEFNLIHARLVLVHVPERLVAIGRLVQALRRGGWLGASPRAANVLQLQDAFLRSQIVTKEEFEHFMGLLDDPSFALAGIFLLSGWGRTQS